MKKFLCLFILSLLMSGCSSKPAPEWIASSHQQIETYKVDFLTGTHPIITERRFRKLTEEIKKSGNLDLLGKAWLTRMALQSVVLENMEEGDYGKIDAAQPVPANKNFYLFLRGDSAAVDGALLPVQYRSFLKTLHEKNAVKMEKAIADMEDDPLSQLIAAGLAVRKGLETEAILQTAVDTASRNGWKRALLAWLERLHKRYETKGDSAKAASIRQRIDIMAK